ncbi:hypothetical protein ACP70R_032383 [Stipagrostis hirtigluma subsp. patula]
MDALLHAKALMAAAAELRLHQAVVTFVFGLAIGALLSFGVRPVLRATASGAAATPVGPALRSSLPHFVALCLATVALLHAEPLAGAAADLGIHPGVVLAAAVLFHWAALSLNILAAARRPAGRRGPKAPHHQTAPAAVAVRSPNLAHSALLVVSALVSASWFVEPFAAAAGSELGLPSAAAVVTIVFLAALFNVSMRHFRCFFLSSHPSQPAAAAARWEAAWAIAAAVVGMSVAAGSWWIGLCGRANS